MPTSPLVHRLPVLLLAVAVAGGCSREKYRERADKDVEAIISQKNVFPQWQVKNWHVYPDQRARFADPFKADAPPFPVDDYAAQLISPNPQKPGKGGVGRFEGDGYLQQIAAWDSQNRAEGDPDAARPSADPALLGPVRPETRDEAEYKAAFATAEKTFRVKLEQTVELALFNSREFQDRREDLYLAALPVSLERFGFSAQAFAAENLIFSAGGRDSAAPGTRWTPGTEFGFSRRLASGAELLVRLANQVVINVGGGRPTVGVSDLSLTLAQPFLRGGGYAVTLENLTQAERTLLYALRSYARFRNLFYFAIVGGGGYTNNPYGLQGLAANLGRGVGANLTANSVGYLPTVLRAAVLANEKTNVEAIRSYLGRFQNLKGGNVISELQVFQVEQQLLQGRARVLQRTQEYVDSIDNFKLQLGVPATLPLELDESPLTPIRRQLQRFEGVFRDLEDVETAAKYDPQEPPATYRERWLKLLTESPLAKGTAFAQAHPAAAEALRKLTPAELTARLAALDARRQKLLDEQVERQKNRQPQPEAADRELAEVVNDRNAARFEQALRDYEGQPWLRSPKEKQAGEQAQACRTALEAGMLLAVVARSQRLEAIRGEWPILPGVPAAEVDLVSAPLDEAYGRAAETALNNRYDVMNARALVVDAWRRVNVVANSLQGVFDIEYDLTASSPAVSDRPFSLGGSRTLHQIRLRLEPPFVRRAERNNYRAALIAYQRQRRNLQAVEDNVITDVRADLRALRQLGQTYKVQQKAVELAYIVVDNAKIAFTAPTAPGVGPSEGNAAALTNQLLSAQQALVQAQNTLYTTWVTYLTTRMDLFLDLELFSIDDRGVWTDDAARPAPIPVPPAGGPPVAVERPRAPGPVVPAAAVEPVVSPRRPNWQPVR